MNPCLFHWRALAKDRRGVTVVEFAIVAPVMLLMLVGAFDLGHTLYTRAILEGVVQKAARDATLESGVIATTQAALDARIRTDVQEVNGSATVEITRRFYKSFTEAADARAETFVDTALPSAFHDGICNNNEAFEDRNNNNVLDLDGGNAGQGGAKDPMIYTVKVSYPRVLPLSTMTNGGVSDTVSLEAVTIFGNQPYTGQTLYGAAGEGHCNP